MNHSFWTDAKRHQVVFMVEEGYRNSAIARHFGVSRASIAWVISKWEREHGKVKRPEKCKRDPIGHAEPPRVVMNVPTTMPRIEPLPEANLTPQERARRMIIEKRPVAYIAATTRLPYRTIQAIKGAVALEVR